MQEKTSKRTNRRLICTTCVPNDVPKRWWWSINQALESGSTFLLERSHPKKSCVYLRRRLIQSHKSFLFVWENRNFFTWEWQMPWRKMLQYFYWWLFWKLDLDTQAGAHTASAASNNGRPHDHTWRDEHPIWTSELKIAYFECFVI